MNGLGRPSVRAVVYTRKSSEEGLDQEPHNAMKAGSWSNNALMMEGSQAGPWTALPLRLCWMRLIKASWI